MDSISTREDLPRIEYQISGDPILEHHFQTLQNAQKKLGRPVTLALVLNVLKKDRLFTVEESSMLAKQFAEYMGITLIDVICLKTKEAVTEHLRGADKIVRRRENKLNSDSPYILNIAEKYSVADFPQKIEWIESQHPANHTSGRLKALVYHVVNHEKEEVRKFCREEALKFAPEFIVEAIELKMREHPEMKHFPLSVDTEIQKILKEIK